MDLVILFDWFTNERMDAALQATEWQQREMFLRLALMWGTAAQHSAAKKHRPKRRLTQTLWSDEALRLQAEARPRLRGGCRDWSENRAASFYRPVRVYRTLCNRCGMVSVGCRYSHFGTPQGT